MSGIRNAFDSGLSWLGSLNQRHTDAFRHEAQQRMAKILGRTSENLPLDPALRTTIDTSRLAQSALLQQQLEHVANKPFISTAVPDPIRSVHEMGQAISRSDLSNVKTMAIPSVFEEVPSSALPKADKTIQSVQSSRISLQAQLGGISAVATVAAEALSKNKLLFALPPLFLYTLYSSKKSVPTKINLGITATSQRAAYQITLGKGAISASVAFELKAGQPIRFHPEQGIAQQDTSEETSLFQPENIENERHLGPLSNLVWDRREHNVLFNIIINDPTAKMTDLPIIPINKREFIRFMYGGSAASEAGSRQSSQTLTTDDLGEEWNGFRAINLDLDKSSGPEAPGKVQTWRRLLPSEEGTFDTNEYIEIVREVLPEQSRLAGH